jgi:hypothetical protein
MEGIHNQATPEQEMPDALEEVHVSDTDGDEMGCITVSLPPPDLPPPPSPALNRWLAQARPSGFFDHLMRDYRSLSIRVKTTSHRNRTQMTASCSTTFT